MVGYTIVTHVPIFCTALPFGTNRLTVSASRGSCASDDLCRCRVPVGLETKLADLGARRALQD